MQLNFLFGDFSQIETSIESFDYSLAVCVLTILSEYFSWMYY